MRQSIRQEQRPSLSIDDVVLVAERFSGQHPPLEQYFSPQRQERFTKEYLDFLRGSIYVTRRGGLDKHTYVALVLSFQFTAPLLGVEASSELRRFHETLSRTYGAQDPDLRLRFVLEDYEEESVGEEEALFAYRRVLDEDYAGKRSIKGSVQGRLRRDGAAAVQRWQREQDVSALAEAFGRSIVIPTFFDHKDQRLLQFYRSTTDGIRYELPLPEELEWQFNLD